MSINKECMKILEKISMFRAHYEEAVGKPPPAITLFDRDKDKLKAGAIAAIKRGDTLPYGLTMNKGEIEAYEGVRIK